MAADRAATLFMERNMTDKERLPRHVAVIMDGNGRWAQKNKVSRLAGHNAGMLAMKAAIPSSVICLQAPGQKEKAVL